MESHGVTDRDNDGFIFSLKKSFHIKYQFKYLDNSYLNDVIDICYLDNNNFIIVTEGGLQIIDKDGDKINHPLLDGTDKITMFDVDEGGARRDTEEENIRRV